MDAEASGEPLPRRSAVDLLAEVEAIIAMMESVNTPSARISLLHLIYERTNESYERIWTLLPAALRTMTPQQQVTLWDRLAHIRRWLGSTAVRVRAR
jgi:hypothetical protein